MLREVLKIFSTRDITEEFVACNCWPVKSGWSITSWKENLGKVPVPDFGSCFRLTKEAIVGSIEHRADDILGPETSNEYKSIKQKLGGTRANRVFHAFRSKPLHSLLPRGTRPLKIKRKASGLSQVAVVDLLPRVLKRRRRERAVRTWTWMEMCPLHGDLVFRLSLAPISDAPISMIAPPPALMLWKSVNMEMSKQEPKSDDGTEGGGKIEVADSAALTAKPHETVMLSARQSSSGSLSAGSSSSLSNDSYEKEQQASADKPTTDVPSAHWASVIGKVSKGGGSQSESDAYFMS
ncbi:hypothetical protein GQ55_7G018000 [Panicum hallii var. hallii]|uniref:Uncharacterized protein n=1 Tax=Panicum hallii var. hallii TaxID=1504633 RepID=A0A2T7CRW6_9POAL|nr:hypothetical protein GQ55_7G018000 [Panicum hallii var. hallii]